MKNGKLFEEMRETALRYGFEHGGKRYIAATAINNNTRLCNAHGELKEYGIITRIGTRQNMESLGVPVPEVHRRRGGVVFYEVDMGILVISNG